MAVFLVKGARDSVLGNISDAGPFEVFLNSELQQQRAGTFSGFLVHNPFNDADSYLEDITVNGQTFTDVLSKTKAS